MVPLRNLRSTKLKSPDRFDLEIFCTNLDRLVISLANEDFGTISLTYSTPIGQRGLGFSMFPLAGDRQGISGMTPASFVVLNKCKLLNSHAVGVLFNGSQIMPQPFFGVLQTAFSPVERDLTNKNLVTVLPGVHRASDTGSDQEEPPDGKVDPWDFSGLYEFDIPDLYCLKENGIVPKDYDYVPTVKTKVLRSGKLKDANKVCPNITSYLVVEALMAKTPIINLDIGSSVRNSPARWPRMEPKQKV